jgi:hypothetical protein
MAEYNDIIKQFKRMCWNYSRDKVQKSCPMCTSYPNCNIGQCRKIAFEQPAHFAATVMRWAKENPEPVYPAWRDWLRDLYGNPQKTMTDILESPIDPEIAQRLNIVPRRKRNDENQESQCHIR